MLLTALAVVFACGCTKPDDTNNGGGGGNNGGGNGGGNNGNTYNGHAYVDLGLPSGTLWATCNVGATTPEGYGDYFAWGETTPKTIYDEYTYKYCNGSLLGITKYCDQAEYGYNGFTDTLTVLLPEDDAATANWGSGWCMPTREQLIELKNNTTCVEAFQNNVKGILLTASNGQSLFLPTAGIRYNGELLGAGSSGHYWSNTLSAVSSRGRCLEYDSYGLGVDVNARSSGLSVRPVRSR